MPIEFEKREGQSDDFRTFLEDVKQTERWREHLRVVGLDSRLVIMQLAVFQASNRFLAELSGNAKQLSLRLLKPLGGLMFCCAQPAKVFISTTYA